MTDQTTNTTMTERLTVATDESGTRFQHRQASLTFAELRLASMLNNTQSLAETLADMVIQIDRLAAARGIDLAHAIKQRFEPDSKSVT